MNVILIFIPFLTLATAQRPTYAGSSPKGYPELHSRFRDPNESLTEVPIGNRIGDDSSTTIKIPIDARGDVKLVQRLNEWPRENRPFWLINAEHIEAQRNASPLASRSGFGETIPARPTQQRSSFLGPLP